MKQDDTGAKVQCACNTVDPPISRVKGAALLMMDGHTRRRQGDTVSGLGYTHFGAEDHRIPYFPIFTSEASEASADVECEIQDYVMYRGRRTVKSKM